MLGSSLSPRAHVFCFANLRICAILFICICAVPCAMNVSQFASVQKQTWIFVWANMHVFRSFFKLKPLFCDYCHTSTILCCSRFHPPLLIYLIHHFIVAQLQNLVVKSKLGIITLHWELDYTIPKWSGIRSKFLSVIWSHWFWNPRIKFWNKRTIRKSLHLFKKNYTFNYPYNN